MIAKVNLTTSNLLVSLLFSRLLLHLALRATYLLLYPYAKYSTELHREISKFD